MPNRILRPWQDSFRVDKLSEGAEIFFVRLIMTVDDFGRFHAHPGLLRASLFPLRSDKVKEKHISDWLSECRKSNLVSLFEYDEKKYLEINDFRQRTRQEKSKFPSPADGCPSSDGQGTVNCQQVAHGDGDGDECVDGDGDDLLSGARRARAVRTEAMPPVMTFPCDGKISTWDLTRDKIMEWAQSFPSVEVEAECRKALQWIRDNSTRRKTAKGMTRFLYGWIERSNNRGGKNANPIAEPDKLPEGHYNNAW
jgi:hypothetical protein